jgi:hypothetical protein
MSVNLKNELKITFKEIAEPGSAAAPAIEKTRPTERE